jgi:TatA/E family protein of Tat protein translocase
MGSFSFAEIVTILLVVLVIFGPNRLPEFARKLGELMAQARRATSQFSREISSDWGDAADPIMAAKEDFDAVKQDLKDATAAITGLGAPEGKQQQSTDDRQDPESENGDLGKDGSLETDDGESEEDGSQTADRKPEAEAEGSIGEAAGKEPGEA